MDMLGILHQVLRIFLFVILLESEIGVVGAFEVLVFIVTGKQIGRAHV